MIMESNLAILGLTLRVGLLSTLLCLPFAICIGYGLARQALPFPSLLRAVISLPMVMPPVAVGLALLWLFGATSPLAPLWSSLGIDLAFTPWAAVVAAAVVGFPLLARSAEQSFTGIDIRYEEIARTLGASRLETFARVSLPLARRGLLYGSLLCFTRALGEFGATLMLAGNIPGRTQKLPLAIYEAALSGEDQKALLMAGSLTLVSVVVMILAGRLDRKTT